MTTRREFLRKSLVVAGMGSSTWMHLLGCSTLNKPYDVCIVGSGFAGMTAALRSVSQGLHTVVVEAGSYPNAQPEKNDLGASFTYTNSGEFAYHHYAHRKIKVGGTSNHWGGVVSRLRPSDFRTQSEFGIGTDWPIDYEELAPYYCRAEQALSVTGFAPIQGAGPPRNCHYPRPIQAPFRSPNVRLESRRLHFVGVAKSVRNGQPVRLVNHEINAFTASPFGTFLAERQVTRIVGLDGNTIDHVVVRSVDGSAEKIRARAFIIAAGVIETPRLLLLSTSQAFPNGLGNQSRIVGQRFTAHPTFRWMFKRPKSKKGLRSGSFRSYDFNDVFRREHLNASHFQLSLLGKVSLWQLQSEMESRPENLVRLSRTERDRFGDPFPDVVLGFSERDWKTRRRGADILHAYATRMGIDPPRFNQKARWRSHPSGTCRMGTRASDGVVDRNGKVFGLKNLYVAGASVFPNAGTANPTLTVVALSMRLGEHLVQRLKGA